MMEGVYAFGVFNHFRVATFNYGYAGVGRTQVNTMILPIFYSFTFEFVATTASKLS
jgi:hypothetical protein